MKKLTKTTVAAASGAVLLLGGGTSLAFWTDAADSDVHVVSAGNLDLDAVSPLSWQVQHDGSSTRDPFAPATDPFVPGDTLYITYSVPVTLKDAAAVFRADTVIAQATVGDVQDEAFVQGKTWSVDSLTVTGITRHGDTVVPTFESLRDTGIQLTGSSAGATTGSVDVTLSVTWPWGAEGSDVTDNPQMLGNASVLLAHTLTQSAHPAVS